MSTDALITDGLSLAVQYNALQFAIKTHAYACINNGEKTKRFMRS